MQPTKSTSYKPVILVASGLVAAFAAAMWVFSPTQPEILQLDAAAVQRLDHRDTITTKAGAGERVLHVFVSADCIYCRKLEPELAKLSNVSIHRHFIPGRAPESRAQAGGAWCASDRAQAWTQMVAGVPLQSSECDTSALDRNYATAKALGLVATPVVITASGKALASFMTHAELEAFLK